jgi:hypothetical protein
MPSGITWPLRRLLDPRFADVTRRVTGVGEELRTVRAQVDALHAVVDGHGEAVVELAVHLGERLDRIEAALERLEARSDRSGT